MRRWLVALVAAAYLSVVAMVVWAQPTVPPAPAHGTYVADYAGVLSAETKKQIQAVGAELQAKTKAHIVAVTVKSLEGAAVEDYSLTLLREWGVGDAKINNGVVLLVAIADRQSRIEVGYGLEGALPDAKTGQLQDEYMLPYFKQGNYDTGIRQGYAALAAIAAKEYQVELASLQGQLPHKKATAAKSSWWDTLPWWGKILLAAAVLLLLIIDWTFFGGSFTWLILSLFRSRGSGGGGGGFGGGSGGGGGSSRKW